MKEKRILAMFITSAVTLVASLAITFGVFMTLADPVVATGVVRYDYAFNAANDSLISTEGDTLKLAEEIVFQPSSSVVWSDEAESQPVWFNGTTYQDEIVYADESVSTKLKVIPFRVANNFEQAIDAKIEVNYDKSTLLGKYTKVKIYDYETCLYLDFNGSYPITLETGAYKDFAIIVFADDSSNFGRYTVDWGNDYQKVNVSITKTTIFE